MTEWKPIETAPKDRAEILASSPYGDLSIVRWDERAGKWVGMCEGSLVVETEGDWGTEYRYPFVTHWMPLPEPPRAD